MGVPREVCACAPRTGTTLSRLEAPRITATSERESPSDPASERSASALASPSTGGGATFSLRAYAPEVPSMEVRLAPRETLRFRRIPSFVGVKGPLLTPAQKAAGPEDAAVPPVLFGGGALIPIEELLRAALLGQG